MLKTKDYKYYEVKLNNDGEITSNNIVLRDGDAIGLPISFSEDTLDFYLNSIKKNIKNRMINDFWTKNYSIVFNVMENHDYTYDEWLYLINYAKNNNIKFLVNILEHYTPEEMENYIEKFAINDHDNKKRFIFHNNNLKSMDNPLLKDNDAFKYIGISSSLTVNEFNESDIDEYIEKQRSKKLNQFDFVLKDGEQLEIDEVNNIKKVIDYIKEKYPNNLFDISFSSNFQYYTKDQFLKLLELENYIKEVYNENYELEFLVCDTIINKKQILNANSKIEGLVNYLRNSGMSPYEKVLYVHNLLAEKEFYDDINNNSLSRDIYTILNSRNIVSIGYSMLMNTIFSELNDENIRVSSELINLNNGKYSCVNCIYLNDEKYDINGYYKVDITKNNGTNELNRFMVPCDDFISICDELGYVSSGPGISCGNLMKNSHYFQKYNDDNYSEYLTRILAWDENIDRLNENTLKFLGEESKENVLNKVKKDKKRDITFYILDEIDEKVENTKAIPIDVTHEALEAVASDFYGLDRYESTRYATNLIKKSVFNSLFQYRRDTCKNEFAKASILVENGSLLLNTNISRRK